MKRIILIAMCVIANTVMISCTNDEVETTPSNNTVKVVADDPGVPILIPPIKPQ